MDNKKPSILGQSGRRKSGGGTQLRSPVVKRPAMAPVSLQGWLHKQGSEGLMLWKKRWFVLSEYCLFYYKGPEEEKLLGSILLPSYKVSPCTADDKIYRKFAFKAEHANMRTYYFAAETREVMAQWMNALSLATILQENTKIRKPLNTSSMNSLANHSADDSDSGFQAYRLRTGPVTNQPTGQDQKAAEGSISANGWAPQSQRNPCQSLPCQPLYANAPPKPKRLNESQYGGSSPDASRKEDVVIYGNHHQIQQERGHYLAAQRITHGGHHPGILPHPDIIRTMPAGDGYLTGMPADRAPQDLGLGDNAMVPNAVARPPENVAGRPENYSDVYKSEGRNAGMDQRSEGLANVNYVKSVNPGFVNYQHFNQHYQGYHQLSPASSAVRHQCVEGNNPRKDKQPPRPHSADFLDLDSKHSYRYPQMPSVDKLSYSGVRSAVARPQRPKSSLDVIHTNDGYYWSEESYAEKMRQSAMYLQNTLPQRSQSSRSNTPSFKQASDANRVPAGPGSGKSDRSSAIARLQCEGDFPDEDRKSPPRSNAKRWSEYEAGGSQFFRSASARLARNRPSQDDESDEVQTYTGGEDFKEDGKKEESMKRLMEWKQRMLQSPLTKKPSGSSTRGSAQNELSKFYKHHALKELERQEARSREELGKKRSKPEGVRVRSRSTDGRRSAMSSSRYNSYSSDDEENCETRKERNRRPSLSGKTRKMTEDAKARKSVPDSSKGSRFLSPDYENLTQQESKVHAQTAKIATGDVKIPGADTESKSPLNGNSIEERSGGGGGGGGGKCDKLSHSGAAPEREAAAEVANQPISECETRGKKEGSNWDGAANGTDRVKEFSYRYVKNAPFKAIDVPSYKVLETPPENIVKSRIKQLGLEGREGDCREVNLKEPLKLSPPVYQANEAHVSTLKNIGDKRSNKSLRDFALGSPVRADAEEASNQKSVKDLLADFERKSQLAQEKENEKSCEESPGKRYVFSDTETLLYDTSSDTEDKSEKPDSSLLVNLNRSESGMRENTNLTEEEEEEDGDEEVAAALARRERLFGSCKNLRRDETSEKFENANAEPSPSSEVETIMTPGYLMSNLTGSVVVREQSDSTYSTPVRVIEKMKDDLERTLPKENLVKSPDVTAKQDTEGHYMPMTPSRRVSAPPSDKSRSNSSLHSILYGAEAEETYVEMSENGTSNIGHAPKSGYSDFNSYCEIPGAKPESHYDFLYKTGSFREPEYMEVNTLLEILKEQDEKIKEHKGAIEKSKLDRKGNSDIGHPPLCRSALPDILNSSATNQQKSDSSDADDESSKDLGSLDIPRHPRFSLSDTFRPASYYLGNDNGRNLIGIPNPSENQDSSDSDLVSPPPIPTSPPPLDDLDTSLETEKSLETRPKLKISEKDASKRLWSKPNRSDFDISEEYKKIKRRPVSEEVLETLGESDQTFYEKKLSMSELDSVGSRNGLVLDEEANNINLNQYLNSLEFVAPVNPQLYSKNMSDSIYKSYEKELQKNLMPKECGSKTGSPDKGLMKELKLKYGDEPNKRNGESSSSFGKKVADHVQYENLQNFFPPPPLELYDPSNDFGLGMYRNISLAEVPPPENYCDAQGMAHQPQIQFDPDTLQQQGEATCKAPEIQGAPYYYSDIIKKDEDEFGSSTSDRSLSSLRSHLSVARYQPLNNQREDLQEMGLSSKRNNIGRKVNPISQAADNQDEPDDMDDMQRITEELRTTTAHFMDVADKSEHFDIRNIYESDTLQRRKSSAPVEALRVTTPDLNHPQCVARNLYPHGLKDKSRNSTFADPQTAVSARRSRSLEGLLNEAEASNCESPAGSSLPGRRSENPCKHHQGRGDKNGSCDGDDLWEKDTLWRENLRKASLRHARSLDNLDEGTATHGRPTHFRQGNRTETTGRRSVDHLMPFKRNAQSSERQSVDYLAVAAKPKLNRDVTYVNDGFRRGRSVDVAREYEQDYREGRIRSKKKAPEMQRVVELSDSGILDCDDGVHYERLTRSNPDRRQMVDVFIESYEWDENREVFRKSENKESHGQQLKKAENLRMEPIDREKLRQWDLMSSGIVEQQESAVREAESKQQERGLENAEEKAAESEAKKTKVSAALAETQQEATPGAEASASGSVMRETPVPQSMSGLSDGQQHSPRFVQKGVAASKATAKDEGFADLETLPNETCDQMAEGLPDRIDYYDRGKSGYPNIANGYPDWSDSYPDRKSEVRDYLKSVPSRRRMAETDFYLDQYPDEKIVAVCNRNCGTLPMMKGASAAPMPPLNLQGSSVGRSVGVLDSRTLGKRKISSGTWGLDVSAGELLGRTHEELVLLLIQLRRQSAGVCKAMETCHIEIEAQARLANMETPKRMEHIQKLEELKKHLLDLEKQYEKGKPLVNLVDNMVKLGSLYRGNNSHSYNGSVGLDPSFNVREKLEFNQKVQEQRLLAEERRDWDRLSPDHSQLQAKVQQLYRLDRLLQEESGTLHCLQQDKELLEKALGGLRHKLQINKSNPIEADRCRKQQKLLEKELSRVRLLLAHNSKKLEETVAENARLEQELVILRQKLQASRVSSRNSAPLLPESATISTTAALEAELRRVQLLVGDLQRQRHELSAQVKQLTEKSDTLVQQIRPGPTGVAGAGPIPGKKKSSSSWLETDLDLLVTQDVGVESPVSSPQHHQQQPPSFESLSPKSTTPIYINTEPAKREGSSGGRDSKSPVKALTPSGFETEKTITYRTPVELSEADERTKRFYGIIPREKQEIKTVRIVKRESERRQRDRDRSGNIGIPAGNTAIAKRVSVIEENDPYILSKVEEESLDNYQGSPNFSEQSEDYQSQKLNGEYRMDIGDDPYMNFHPTNPFLPQNMGNLREAAGEEQPPPSNRSMSLPRGFGKSSPATRTPAMEGGSLKSVANKRNRVRFENQFHDESASESGRCSPRNSSSPCRNFTSPAPQTGYPGNRQLARAFGNVNQRPFSPGQGYFPNRVAKVPVLDQDQREYLQVQVQKQKSPEFSRPLSAREQLFGSSYMSPDDENSPQLSPVYQSEAAREIIMEMSSSSGRSNANRRQVPREKRRHHTVSNIQRIYDNESFLKMNAARSRDDLDMERALRPRINAPDVVRSTMSHKDLKYNENTIDNILGTPNKIIIPERYIPEQEPALTAEEQLQRLKKAESIRKMLSETTALSTPDLSKEGAEEDKKSSTLRKKVEEEKKQREHLLELNQILAQQVMEKSKLVAAKAMAALPLERKESLLDEEDLSPVQPLPLYQQRENYFS